MIQRAQFSSPKQASRQRRALCDRPSLEEGVAELSSAGAPECEVLNETEEESEEARPPKRMNDPKELSAEERRSHALTHLPYRTWCTHCVREKRRAADQRRCPAEENLTTASVAPRDMQES